MISPKSCPICYNDYNLKDRLPRIIPSCGHTFCTTCLYDCFKKGDRVACPFDRTFFEARNPEACPVNFQLKDFIEENIKAGGKGSEENMKVSKLSIEKKKSGSTMNKQKEEAQILKGLLNQLSTYEAEIEHVLKEQEKTFLEDIKNGCGNYKLISKENKAKVATDIKAFYKNERTLTNMIFGSNSTLRSLIKLQVTNLKQSSENPGRPSVLEGTTFETIVSKFDNEIFRRRLEELTKRLQDVAHNFHHHINAQMKASGQCTFLCKDTLAAKVFGYFNAFAALNAESNSYSPDLKKGIDEKKSLSCITNTYK